jgi:hypothetical protein
MAFRRVLLNGTNVEEVKQNLEDYFSTKLFKSNYPSIKPKIIVSPTKNDTLVIDLNGDGADTVSKKVKDIGIKYKMTAKIKNEKPMSSVKESTTIKKSELTQLIKEEIKNVLNENFKSFDDLEFAIKQYEKDSSYYDMTKLKNIFNQLEDTDQQKARTKYSKYFGK